MKKSLIISSLIALATIGCYVVAQTQGPAVVSDKADYMPGETAHFSASGFQGSEFLDFSVGIRGDDGTWIPDIAWADVPADASGSAHVDYVVPQTWADKTLQLTVMGLTSGLMAQTTFTDTVITLSLNSPTTGAPVHVTTAGGSITANVSYTTSCTGGGCGDNQANVHFKIDATDANQYNNVANNATNVDYTVTVPAGLTVGCHNLILQVIRQGQGTATQTCAIIIDAPTPTPTPTPEATPTATPTPTPCMNNAPVITCASPTPDLGSAVGCLDGGFTHDYPVTYTTDPVSGIGNPVTVKATFTRPAPLADVTVDMATVSDDAGDTVTVTLSMGTNPVTISGPGNGSAPFSVHIHAEDDNVCPMNNTADNTCGGTASADIVYHVHYLPPLSDTATTKVKQGSTAPVKMQLTDCHGVPITPDNIPGGTPTLASVEYLSGVVPSGPAEIDDAGQSSGDTTYFRWTVDGMFWIFNLKTNSTYSVGTTYSVWPSDVDAAAKISIK